MSLPFTTIAHPYIVDFPIHTPTSLPYRNYHHYREAFLLLQDQVTFALRLRPRACDKAKAIVLEKYFAGHKLLQIKIQVNSLTQIHTP